MGRIRILSDTVANKIAAGEVVERPASVVKELLENSLDAGATDLRVAVEAGGRKLIRISDDGCGMLRDDAMLAFERHATSKLKDVQDLTAISTLGFRGEALPSIASVSRLLLETRAAEETSGTAVEIAGGKLLRCDEIAAAPGTRITVRDLFFNVPARRKFLRSEQTELAHIASLVTHYSLAHPEKSFELTHGPHELLRVSPAPEMRDRVYQVFGSQIMTDLVDLGLCTRDLQLPAPYLPPSASVGAQMAAAEEAEGEERVRAFALRGFVSGPHVQKSNRNSVYLFVNGRLIRDKLLIHALSSAYHNLMPPGAYPFALLFLDCDAEEVDVNVHPSKTEVRFRHGSFVHDFVRDSIRELLMDRRPVSAIPGRTSPAPLEFQQPAARLPYSEFTQSLENFVFDAALSAAPEPGAVADRPVLSAPQDDAPLSELPSFAVHDQQRPPQTEPPVGAEPLRLSAPDTHGALPAGSYSVEPQSYDALRDLRPLGQIHDSFIVAAGRDGLWIIDQHVAHERILFEKVLRERSRGQVEMQALLMPMVIDLTAAQQIEYARIADELNASGFDTEPFGNRTVAIKAAPAGLPAGDVERALFEILEIAERELRKVSVDDLRRGIAASVACRAAIKVNMRLEPTKIDWLLRALSQCEYPMTCPHGRPIALRYNTRDILRSFHRI
jgi:DNA mismatch repair protein MutL